MNDDVQNSLENLRKYRDKHYEIGKSLFQAVDDNVYTLDFLFSAALNRSYCLLRGFCDLIESRNFVAAAPLIRLQLDSCLRIAALGLVDDPHSLASAVLGGKSIRAMKDKNDKRMTDDYLCSHLAKDHPWIHAVYKETSGFVHLSEKHIFNAMTVNSIQQCTVILKLSDRDKFVPDHAYMEAIDVFGKLTNLLLEFIAEWGSIKASFNNSAKLG